MCRIHPHRAPSRHVDPASPWRRPAVPRDAASVSRSAAPASRWALALPRTARGSVGHPCAHAGVSCRVQEAGSVGGVVYAHHRRGFTGTRIIAMVQGGRASWPWAQRTPASSSQVVASHPRRPPLPIRHSTDASAPRALPASPHLSNREKYQMPPRSQGKTTSLGPEARPVVRPSLKSHPPAKCAIELWRG